jgi:fructose-bisphosphate aldolase class I
MSTGDLETTIRALMTPGKGILAADESNATIARRFEAVGIESTEENRRLYRQMLFTTPGVSQFISGVILFDETLRQRADDGRRFVEILADQGMTPGIKVDRGAKPLAGAPGERVTEGLDGLRERLGEYRGLGARFAKWRAVIAIGDGRPSASCLDANAHALARYAALCQDMGLVPIVEPEVLMDGDHSIERCFEVTEATLDRVFGALRNQRVVLEHVLLKPNMVVPGAQSPRQASVPEVAGATVRCLRRAVPAAVPGIVFLSGGQDAQVATAHLKPPG